MAAKKGNTVRLNKKTVEYLEWYLIQILATDKRYVDLRNKMTSIDEAYFRYMKTTKSVTTDGSATNAGVDQRSADYEVGATESEINVPVVISQVGSYTGYLADVYLSGYPIFPVVSEPNQKDMAEMLESIIDSHSMLGGGYARNLLLSFLDGVKYNFQPIEHEWYPIEQYDVVDNYLKPRDANRMAANSISYTRVRRICPYNTVWDYRVSPAQVAADGEFIGHIQLMPRIPLRRFINRHSSDGVLYNISEIDKVAYAPASCYYHRLPQVSNRVLRASKDGSSNDFWSTWLATGNPMNTNKPDDRTQHAGQYEIFTCYARIIPSEFGITDTPRPNSPMMWKFILLNGKKLIYACPVYTAYDVFPMMIGQPLEDSFEIQTESIGEAQIPMQDAASKLFSIRFNSARRAISDRALFDEEVVNRDDVNAPVPAAKIGVRLSGLNDKTLADAYHQIPFEDNSAGLIGDVRNILEMANLLSGQNRPMQGQFQKGNKSVQEWQDTMSGADARMRMPALMTEFQLMVPLKAQLKLNIMQNGVEGTFQSKSSGKGYKVDPQAMTKLREAVMSFRIADGFTPKSKMASTQFLTEIMQMIGQSEILMQSWGAGLPKMFAHLAQLGGVRGLEQYLPQPDPSQQPPAEGGAGGQPPAPAPAAA